METFVLDPPTSFVQELLECGGADGGVSVDVAFNHRPQRLHSAGRQVFKRTCAVFGLVHRLVLKVVFAVVVSPPEVSVHFCTVNYVVPDHLQTRYLCPVPHNERSDVFAATLVKAKYPDFVLDASFSVVSKFRFIYFNSSAEMSKFVSLVVILKVNVNELPDSPVNVVNVLVLETRYFEFLEIPECLHCVEPAREVVKDDS